MTDQSNEACQYVMAQLPSGWQPQVGLTLGSGLGALVDAMTVVARIAYRDIPGFVAGDVAGHAQALVLGELAGVRVACLQGRVHAYEGIDLAVLRTMMRCLQRLGCHTWLGTNAVGSMREDCPPGALVLITDHINFQGINPLVGPNDASVGPRFMPMGDAYDVTLRDAMHAAAKAAGVTLQEGVLIGVLGPSYETAAEIRAFKTWGADVVGMSTVPEVILARHCGLKVAVISTVTNMATGMAMQEATHDDVVAVAEQAAGHLQSVLQQFLAHCKR